MKHRTSIYLVILLGVLLGCGRANPKPYLAILETGITKQVDFARFPQGKVTIMSGLSSAMESGDAKSMRFPLKYLEYLQQAEEDQLLTLSERQQNSLEQITNMGARFFKVAPTETLRQMADPKESGQKWLAVQIGAIKVLEIMSEEPCKLRQATPGDEFILVVGLLSDTPTQHAKALGPRYGTVEPQELKFRAILQLNPFDKTYRFIIADVGRPDETEWKSDNVARIIDG